MQLFYIPVPQTGILASTVKALINARAFIRIITYHRDSGGRLLEATQLTKYK